MMHLTTWLPRAAKAQPNEALYGSWQKDLSIKGEGEQTCPVAVNVQNVLKMLLIQSFENENKNQA